MKVLYIPSIQIKCVSLKDPFMDLNKPLVAGIFFFHENVKKFGFSRSEDESCVYVKASGSNVVFLVLYVDDILLIGNNIPMLQDVKVWLGKCFAMKDLGNAAYILGIRIYRDRTKLLIGLSQSTNLDKILKKFNMNKSKKGYLPMQHGIRLSKDQCPHTSEKLHKMSRILMHLLLDQSCMP